MSEYSLLINGDLVKTKDSFPVINPANGEVFARAPECSVEQVNQAVEAAEKWNVPVSIAMVVGE